MVDQAVASWIVSEFGAHVLRAARGVEGSPEWVRILNASGALKDSARSRPDGMGSVEAGVGARGEPMATAKMGPGQRPKTVAGAEHATGCRPEK